MIIFSIRLIAASLLVAMALTASPTTKAALNDPAVLSIELPPFGLTTRPAQFHFGGTTCDFGVDSSPDLANCNPGRGYVFSKQLITSDDTSTELDDRYILRVSNFPNGDGLASSGQGKLLANINEKIRSLTSAQAFAPPPASHLCAISPISCGPGATPYGFQVTFAGGVSGTLQQISGYAIYLSRQTTPSIIKDHVYLGNASCAGTATSNLCLKTKLSLRVFERFDNNLPDLDNYLIQTVSANQGGAIQFDGNVAGGGTLADFKFTDPAHTVAVGGTVNAQVTNKISNYVDGSKLGWSVVGPKLNKIFNDNKLKGTAYTPFNKTYTNANWNLNSNSDSPVNTIKSSFSTPPEGKLWHVEGGNVTFTAGTTFFNGRGTLAVDGDVTFNGNVSCQDGQVGIIASGSITFRGDVNCGAFVALGRQGNPDGNITFTKSVNSTTEWTGIFVAENNIDLPPVTNGMLIIHYNALFANDPTVLFKELLGIVFSTDS